MVEYQSKSIINDKYFVVNGILDRKSWFEDVRSIIQSIQWIKLIFHWVSHYSCRYWVWDIPVYVNLKSPKEKIVLNLDQTKRVEFYIPS